MMTSHDVTAFRARYLNSLHKNEFMQRIRKADGQRGRVNTIICVVEFQFPFDAASKFLKTTILNIFIAKTQFFSCLAQNKIINDSYPISQLFFTIRTSI